MSPDDLLATRAAAVGLRAGDNVSALHARSEGAATRLLALAWPTVYQAVLALPSSCIAEPAQLAGRRLALPLRARSAAASGTVTGPHDGFAGPGSAPLDVERIAASRGFQSATGLACLFCDEYAFVDVPVGADAASRPYAAERAALLSGAVDAIYVAGPEGCALAQRIGAVEVVDLGTHLDPLVRVNATTPLTLTAAEATLDAAPDAVARRLASRLRRDGAGWTLAPHALAALGAQRDFLRTRGVLDADVDLAAWVDPAPLAAAQALLAR